MQHMSTSHKAHASFITFILFIWLFTFFKSTFTAEFFFKRVQVERNTLGRLYYFFFFIVKTMYIFIELSFKCTKGSPLEALCGAMILMLPFW